MIAEPEGDRRRFEAAVLRFMDTEGLWPEDGGLLVGVSGGPDSTALLLALHRLARRREIDLTVAHFNHGLRAAGTSDEAAVRKLATSLGLQMMVSRGKVQELAAWKVHGVSSASHASIARAVMPRQPCERRAGLRQNI